MQIIGLIAHNKSSLQKPVGPGEFDVNAIRQFARTHDDAGFDRVLIANTSSMPDSFPIGTYVASVTSNLGLMLAHRPGFIAPTMAARMLSTIDRISGGRAAVHIIPGASDLELQADGDFLTKDERLHRAAEYVDVMRRTWRSSEPFDYDGQFYKLRGAHAAVRPEAGRIPVFWGGESDLAIELAGRWCDIYAVLSDTIAGAGELADRAHAAAAKAGRQIDVLMTMGIILGDTEDEAWEKAATQLQRTIDAMPKVPDASTSSLDKQWQTSNALARIAKRAEEAERHDKCLWTGINRVMKGRGNHNALVGTPDQVAESLLDYYRRGISHFLLRGFDVLPDAERIGRELIPILRREASLIDEQRLEPADFAGAKETADDQY